MQPKHPTPKPKPKYHDNMTMILFPHQYNVITLFVAVVACSSPCRAFHQVGRCINLSSFRTGKCAAAAHQHMSLSAAAESQSTTLNTDIASQFTVQVCTSTSCTKKLNDAGLDQYHVLGEIYALAQVANVEKCMIIEDGGCQGGKNCKMGAYIRHNMWKDFRTFIEPDNKHVLSRLQGLVLLFCMKILMAMSHLRE